MECIYCGGKTGVSNSRLQKRRNQIWRRRKCIKCQAIFTTLEVADLTNSLSFRTKTSNLEPFSRHKLFLSIHSACGHRNDAEEVASALTDTVIGKLLPNISSAEIHRAVLVKTTLDTVKKFDTVAGIQYNAYHSVSR